jgi:hypothetical protein
LATETHVVEIAVAMREFLETTSAGVRSDKAIAR